MNVRILILAQGAYACITEAHRTLDVRLNPGRSATKALREYVERERERAATILARAELAERAAMKLEA